MSATIIDFTVGEGGVEVVYFEKNDQGKRAGIIKRLSVGNEVCQDMIDAAVDVIRDIVDEGLRDLQRGDAPTARDDED